MRADRSTGGEPISLALALDANKMASLTVSDLAVRVYFGLALFTSTNKDTKQKAKLIAGQMLS